MGNLNPPATADSVEYKDSLRWRFTVERPVFIPFLSSGIINAMAHSADVVHPFFRITKEGVHVEQGYSWDGATGVIFQTENLRIPSLVHDIGCQAVNLKLLPRWFRPHFDTEYKARALRQGVHPLRVAIHFTAITLWGLIPKKEGVAPYSKIHVVDIL